MFSFRRLGLGGDLERRPTRAAWVAWARVAAAPFALVEVALERGSYPSGDETLAWAAAGAFAVGALVLLGARERRWAPEAGLAFDLVAASAFVALYSYESGTAVRALLALPVVEGAFLLGPRAGALLPLAALPSLGFFEWRQAERLGYHELDPGHVVGPAGILLLVGVAVGMLVARLENLQRRV